MQSTIKTSNFVSEVGIASIVQKLQKKQNRLTKYYI